LGGITLASSIVLFSTGVILCESPDHKPSTSPSSSISSRKLTAEDEAYARKAQSSRTEAEVASEKGAIDRIKSSISDIQTKLSTLEAPSIKLSPETFGLPPHFMDWVDKIRAEVSFAPGSVSDEIWQESQDPIRNPEIEVDARVWLGNSFCKEELEFQQKRRKFTKRGLATYLGVKESEIDEKDIPTIAVAGSGGGYRAMLGTTGYFKAMKEAGLFDCVTYMAGMS
jgi:cytosolic phospholipase A2